jgi:hypothetical protein
VIHKKTTTTNKMPTTAINANANANAQKKQPKMIAKWSGSDEPQSCYDHEEDTDTATLTRDEANYIRWYHSIDHSKWRNVDEENDVRVATAVAPPPRISSSFWTTPLSIASGEEPMFEPEYPEYEECTHVPFMNLTKEQRAEKSKNFKFGLCCDCDAGLDDKSEFVRQTRLNGDVKMCNACHNYHMDVFERNIGGEHGGCN